MTKSRKIRGCRLGFNRLFSALLSVCILLLGMPSHGIAANQAIQIGKLVLEPYKFAEPSGFLTPGKTRIFRIRAYNKEGHLLSDKVLQDAVRKGKLHPKVFNPVGSQVITHTDIPPPINWMPDGAICVTITAGKDAGAARVEIRHDDFPKIVGRRLVSVGSTKTIKPTKIEPTNITPTKITPGKFMPMKFRAKKPTVKKAPAKKTSGAGADDVLLIGAVVAAGAAAALLIGSMDWSGMGGGNWYLSTPSGYRRMGGASRLGPYSSKSQCESVNSSYFHGSGRCYQ